MSDNRNDQAGSSALTRGAADGPSASRQSVGWESQLIRELATSTLKEQRRARRWGIFFKLLIFAYLSVVLLAFARSEISMIDSDVDKYTAVIDVHGIISAEDRANAARIIASLKAAFVDQRTAGIILDINSPGGSPVQAGIIYDEIVRLRGQYPETPVYAVLGDICASGGYYVAAAADKIYADKASIVGSIGVRMGGFGFTRLMEKTGVERRLLTSGESKALLDPFLPENSTEKRHMQTLLDSIHMQFIDSVQSGRGERLTSDPRLFSGLIWTGQQSVENGLVDALGSPNYVAREVIGAEHMVLFNPQDDFVDQLFEQLESRFSHAVESLLPLDSLPLVLSW